ncbi:uncharacterized protein Aud_006793 [Aspergillus udagawae]|uniref:Carboxylesterase type B domain-containing protein n=1 Tax=Aspergillus udagawae TaxID=91492 RepID=A0A8E0V349_9EURO|nr:uncharacterized protein Aud_006793 [Aspergillus udagawae]GIC90359.1 hypothetical protein Aud_006793 [Aspergillus udagawae]
MVRIYSGRPQADTFVMDVADRFGEYMTPKDSDNVTEEILVLDLSGKPDGIFNKSIVGVVLAHPVTGEKQCQRFTGIPFAQPPIGDLRWEKPVPLEAPNTLSEEPFRAT